MPSLINTEMKKEELQVTTALQPSTVDSSDGVGQVKQSIQNKIRNLEKRKAKLESYKESLDAGKELNAGQMEAYSQLDSVLQSIDLQNEFLKLVTNIQVECAKQQKMLKKKEERERQQACINQLRDLFRYQDILNLLGNEEPRRHFLNGTRGAPNCSADIQLYDDLFKKLCPEREESSEWEQTLDDAAQCAYHLLNGTHKPMPAYDHVTFHQVKEKLDTLCKCEYFTGKFDSLTDQQIDIPASQEPVDASHPSTVSVIDSLQDVVPPPVNSYESSPTSVAAPATVSPLQEQQQAVVPTFEQPAAAGLVNGTSSVLLPPVSNISFLTDEAPVTATIPQMMAGMNLVAAATGAISQPTMNYNIHASAAPEILPYSFTADQSMPSAPTSQAQTSFTYPQQQKYPDLNLTMSAQSHEDHTVPTHDQVHHTAASTAPVEDQFCNSSEPLQSNATADHHQSEQFERQHASGFHDQHADQSTDSTTQYHSQNQNQQEDFVTQGRRLYRGSGGYGGQNRDRNDFENGSGYRPSRRGGADGSDHRGSRRWGEGGGEYRGGRGEYRGGRGEYRGSRGGSGQYNGEQRGYGGGGAYRRDRGIGGSRGEYRGGRGGSEYRGGRGGGFRGGSSYQNN